MRRGARWQGQHAFHHLDPAGAADSHRRAKSARKATYRFELRLLAEIGLVGYPNAGKSTLLGAISAAQPKIAAYPFTTLHPNIGIVEFADYSRLTVCDIPGIIEGAHDNVGLGHAFLRHILRCRVLVLLIDMAGTDEREPWDDYNGNCSPNWNCTTRRCSSARALSPRTKWTRRPAPEKLKDVPGQA